MSTTLQHEARIYPTMSVVELNEKYIANPTWCASFEGDELAYYFRKYDSWPVDSYLA